MQRFGFDHFSAWQCCLNLEMDSITSYVIFVFFCLGGKVRYNIAKDHFDCLIYSHPDAVPSDSIDDRQLCSQFMVFIQLLSFSFSFIEYEIDFGAIESFD